MLRRLYTWIMEYASHPKAIWMLGAISFAESSFFPLPPDPLYLAMLVSKPERAWRLALLCTITSVLGGILGYYIGYGLYETLGVWIVETYGLKEKFTSMQQGFQQWGFWIVALKGLTPIPYKIVTIGSGVAQLNLMTFLVASMIARGFRFFLLATVVYYSGTYLREFIEKYLGLLTTLMIAALIGGFVILKYIW